jgi:protein SCO1/2
MGRTAWLCAALLALAYASASWLTHDFQAWTAEGARRLEVALHPVATPAVTADGPAIADRELHALLANGEDVTIAEFFYTQCQSVCLALGSSFQQMQATLQADGAHDAAARRVRLLSVSFDPQRDTPAALAAYARRMRADAAIWRFVRVPDPAQTRRLLSAFQVVVVPDGRGDYEHNAALLVIDGGGRLVRVFDIAEQQMALDYARHLAAGGAG